MSNKAFLAGFVMLGLAAAAEAQQPTSIGTLGGTNSYGKSINASGQVAGWSDRSTDWWDTQQIAFLWTPDSANLSTGTMVNLGTLGGSWSVATAISQNGKVAGYSALPDGRAHAFLWTPGGTAGPASNPQMQDLGLLNGYDTLALGVNSAGQVSGVDMSPGAGRPWLWTPGGSAGFPDNPQMQDLGTFGGTLGGFATGITETGAVTGAAYLFGNATTNSFIWVPEAPNSTTGTMMNTGTLLGPRIAPWSINASGQIAGWADADSSGMTHAFVAGPFLLGGNEAPTADDQDVLVQKDKSTVIMLTGSDPEDASLSFIVVTAPAHGNLTGTGAVLTYKPAKGFEGADSFTFTVNDGQADSPVATVSIEVGKRPKPPKK